MPSPRKGREDGDCYCRQEGADPGCVPPPSSLLLGGGGHHPPLYGARLGDGACPERANIWARGAGHGEAVLLTALPSSSRGQGKARVEGKGSEGLRV